MSFVSRRNFIVQTGCTLAAPFLNLKESSGETPSPDIIYFNGKIVTVDSAFSIAQAVAIRGDRFLAVGSNADILNLAGRNTQKIDLEGCTVLPGLIEAHAHPESASLSETDYPLPNPVTVDECLTWIKMRAAQIPDGEWIIHPKLFPTRLNEMRSPTLKELDAVAPNNPVFLNAAYGGMINSAAMQVSGITPNTEHSGLLRDPQTGKLTGIILVTALGLLKRPAVKNYSVQERAEALEKMFYLYNKVGFTGVTSGGWQIKNLDLYHYMRNNQMLTLRVFANIWVNFPFKDNSPEEIKHSIETLGCKTSDGDEWIKIGRLKTTIDGGILTGTAYLREPWGEKAGEVYGIDDPDYRGIVQMTPDEFANLVRPAAEAEWSMTAHCTGGGGVDLMLDAYEKVNDTDDVSSLRFSIIHGNFYTPEAMTRAKRFNVIADMQPAWFYKDADAMLYILGKERIKTFHPYRSLFKAGVVVSAGSDHMIILDDKDSINPYSPWLAMWSMITRKTQRGATIVPEEAITREQALRCYTINNAYASFEENSKGSVETGKYADMVVIDRDFLKCPEDVIKDIQVKMTMVGGEVVYGGL
ncbi:MAG: amidohydrolase [Candidatus Latescibacteria bacterium]|nr:amidohydrolase [Candidatus Latescibacterota bacterium]